MDTKRPTYDTLPEYPLAQGRLASGYAALAERLLASRKGICAIDGMSGVDWGALRAGLQAALTHRQVAFVDVASARLGPEALRRLLADSLDNGDAVFGKLYAGHLIDFFDAGALAQLRRQALPVVFGNVAPRPWRGVGRRRRVRSRVPRQTAGHPQ